MTGHESLDGPVFVKPIMPPMKDHPGLKVAKSQKLFSFSSHLQKSAFKYQLSNTVHQLFVLGAKVLMNNFRGI